MPSAPAGHGEDLQLSAVMKEAGNLSQVGDDGEQPHAPAAGRRVSTTTAKLVRSTAQGR
jgi:hypothetical protein